MADENSANDVFRFVQLRPRRALRDTPTIPIRADTKLAEQVTTAPDARARMVIANRALGDRRLTIEEPADVRLGDEIASALAELRDDADATIADLRARVPGLATLASGNRFAAEEALLSDTLLASFFATRGLPLDLDVLQAVYRVYALVHVPDEEAEATLRLRDYLAWRLLAPPVARPAEAPIPRTVPSPTRRSPADLLEADARLGAAIAELSRLDRPETLVRPLRSGAAPARGARPFTLNAAARARVSRPARAVLSERGLDLATTPIDAVITTLGEDRLRGLHLFDWPAPVVTVDPGPTLPPPPAQSTVRPAGVADLLVVKQQIKRYEAGEIAHVENVLAHEKKSRAHRQLDRSEETVVTETEVTRQEETELQTADRFELNRETSRTIKEDQQIGVGLSLSGKYGPTVEFSSSFDMDLATSTEESSKSSSRFAKEVVSRSLERVTERTRQLRSRTVIRETEETNLHELNNQTADHSSGVYQFIDKVYEAQVFNYGVREMFDFMVPEPASFLWYVEQHPSLDLTLPPQPPRLELVVPDARFIDEFTVAQLAATFGATDIEPAPPMYRRLSAVFKHGTDNADEEGQPHSADQKELAIPAGYKPLRAWMRGLAFTDQHPVIGVAIGSQTAVWQPTNAQRIALSSGNQLAVDPELFLDISQEAFEMTGEAKLGISLLAWETNTYTMNVVVVVQRTEEELDRWRTATYKKLRAAYDESVRQWEQKVEQLRAEAEARAQRDVRRPFGAPPAENARIIATELKKHCISIITQQRFDTFDATKDGTPPWFDFVEAAAEGAYVRFFEQAFEWDQLQYVCYPYFWGRKPGWIERFVRQEVDPVFMEFLRAGSARVVVPVRPGFETAVTHFIETGKLWGGEGEPPQINSPLYVSIVDEIRERTGAPQGEIAVGDPWDVRVPTALVIVRRADTLPEWERTAPGVWSWRPVTSA